MTRTDEVVVWAQGLDALVERIGPRCGRVAPRRRARAELRGLLSPVARTKGWQLAEAAGDATPGGRRCHAGRRAGRPEPDVLSRTS